MDCGAETETEARDLGIQSGDPICYVSPLVRLGEHRVAGKALDNRIGCCLLLRLTDTVRSKPGLVGDGWSLVLGFTVQEEIGARGAEVLVRGDQPTVVVVVDAVTASERHLVPPPTATARLGAGPVVRAMDLFSPGGAVVTRGLVYSRPLRDLAHTVAARVSVPVQADVARTWTDGGQACSSKSDRRPQAGTLCPPAVQPFPDRGISATW